MTNGKVELGAEETVEPKNTMTAGMDFCGTAVVTVNDAQGGSCLISVKSTAGKWQLCDAGAGCNIWVPTPSVNDLAELPGIPGLAQKVAYSRYGDKYWNKVIAECSPFPKQEREAIGWSSPYYGGYYCVVLLELYQWVCPNGEPQ